MKQDIIDISSPFNTIKNDNGGKGILILHKRNKKISIEGTFYQFSDIDSYEITEEIIQKQNPSQTIIKTNTGNMAKRAIIGGIAFGGIGAVAGALTASKTIETKEEPVLQAIFKRIFIKLKSGEIIEIKGQTHSEPYFLYSDSEQWNKYVTRYCQWIEFAINKAGN